MASGFDTLNSFKTDLVIEPVRPVESVPDVQGGTFKVTEPQNNEAKNQAALEVASQAVDQTPAYNNLALQNADQFLPVQRALEDQYSAIAERMGLGERVTFEQALQGIQDKIGPLPRTSGIDKSLNILVDSINARTPYKGAAGIFDIIAQATGKYIDRETAEDAAELQHSLKMKELAIQTMQDQNAAILEKEAEFYLKKMGFDNDFMMKNLGFTMDMQKKLAQFDLDKTLKIEQAALDLYKNPNRLFQNMTIPNEEDGSSQVVMTKKVWNPKKGTYEFMMGRREGDDTIFDVEVPPNAYLSPLEGIQEDAALSVSAPNYGQASQQIGDFNTLGRAADIVTEMLNIDAQAVANGEPSRFGAEGLVDFFKKESRATFASFLNAVGAGLGDQFAKEGSTLREKDKVFYQLPEGEEELVREVNFQAPRDSKLPFNLGNTKTVSKFVTIDDFYNPTTYTSLGYDGSYARLKVQENLIIYALARSLKPTGRLNVDDIRRASDLVNLQGLKSPDFVRSQLEEILRFLRKGQVDIFEAGKYGQDKNIFDDVKYGDQVQKFRQFLGEDVDAPTPPAPDSSQSVESAVTDDEDNFEISLEPEDLLGSGN